MPTFADGESLLSVRSKINDSIVLSESAFQPNAQFFTIQSITNSTSLPIGQNLVLADASSGLVEVTLPQASLVAGRFNVVKKTDDTENFVKVLTQGSETIDGNNDFTIINQYTSLTFVSNGLNWFII